MNGCNYRNSASLFDNDGIQICHDHGMKRGITDDMLLHAQIMNRQSALLGSDMQNTLEPEPKMVNTQGVVIWPWIAHVAIIIRFHHPKGTVQSLR
jgi:hypothetical protein